jgi:hypothetical protein
MVVHRSANRVITAGAKTEPNEPWFEKTADLPHRPIGHFQNIVPIVEEIKMQLEHTNEWKPDPQKQIN